LFENPKVTSIFLFQLQIYFDTVGILLILIFFMISSPHGMFIMNFVRYWVEWCTHMAQSLLVEISNKKWVEWNVELWSSCLVESLSDILNYGHPCNILIFWTCFVPYLSSLVICNSLAYLIINLVNYNLIYQTVCWIVQ